MFLLFDSNSIVEMCLTLIQILFIFSDLFIVFFLIFVPHCFFFENKNSYFTKAMTHPKEKKKVQEKYRNLLAPVILVYLFIDRN